MEPLNEKLVERIDRYVEDLLTPEEPTLAQNVADANLAGIPEIQISRNQGKFLYLVAKMSGARRILEIGTLAGYSTTWLARALPPEGTLVTLEFQPKHAEVARRNLERSGVGDKVQVIAGPANESLRKLIEEGSGPFDLIFIDADKSGYPEYLKLCLQLSRPGTVILADNVIRNGNVMEENPPDPYDRGAREYNQALAENPRLESVIVPVIRLRIDGLAISIVR